MYDVFRVAVFGRVTGMEGETPFIAGLQEVLA